MGVHGLYRVGDSVFETKSLATLHAAKTNQKVIWDFHDTVWKNFSNLSLGTLGKITLDAMYKLRAEQLRDKYDYLILNYSGGADSHNILMTFINNNIRLDEIFVRWSDKVNSKLYTPNTEITGAENIFSEWDYVIKPTLDWVARTHPEIKITIGDQFAKDPHSLYNDRMFEKLGQYTGWLEIGRGKTYSDSIKPLFEKNKKVASIYGIDKPIIISKNNRFYMFFNDAPVHAAHDEDGYASAELFYYSPDLPSLPFEQAYVLFKYFSLHTEYRDLIDFDKIKKGDPVRIKWMEDLTKKLIYTTWDDRKFQAEKPVPVSTAGRSRDAYYNHPGLKHIKDIWQYHFDAWYNSLQSKDVLSADAFYQKIYYSDFYYIGEFSE